MSQALHSCIHEAAVAQVRQACLASWPPNILQAKHTKHDSKVLNMSVKQPLPSLARPAMPAGCPTAYKQTHKAWFKTKKHNNESDIPQGS